MKSYAGKKIIKRSIAVVTAAALIFGGYRGYLFFRDSKSEAAAAEAQTGADMFALRPAQAGDVREVVTAAGVVYLLEENGVTSESSDRIKKINFETGDTVNSGDVVAVYDVEEKVKTLERKISDTKIQLDNARLNLESLAAPISDTEKKKLSDAVISAEKTVADRETAIEGTQKDIALKLTEIEKAEQNAESYKILLDAGAVTNDEYEKTVQTVSDQKTALDKLYVTLSSNGRDLAQAKSSLESAEFNYSNSFKILGDESQKLKYRQQENSVKSASQALTQAQEDLAAVVYETLSEYSGEVISVPASEGGSVQTGGVLLTVSDFDRLTVKADVSEFDAPKLALGQRVEMYSDGIPGVIYTGSISKISRQAVKSNGSDTVVQIEITLENPDGVLKPGYNLEIDIIAADVKDVLCVTQAALIREPKTGKDYVYTVSEDERAVKTYVKTGTYGDINVEIKEGLEEGQTVIVNPSENIFDGMPVNEGFPDMRQTRGEGGSMFGNIMGGRGQPGGGAIRIQGGAPSGR